MSPPCLQDIQTQKHRLGWLAAQISDYCCCNCCIHRLQDTPPESLEALTSLKDLRTLHFTQPLPNCVDQLTTNLLPKLPSLQSLDMHCRGLTSLQQLSGISKITRLTKLTLQQWEPQATMAEADLEILRPLTCLTELQLSLMRQCSEQAQAGFKASMPCLKHIFSWPELVLPGL